jgi:hypothetical protein
MAYHVSKTRPTFNFTSISQASPLTLDNLDSLNEFGGKEVYLTSRSDVTKLPKYLHGQKPNAKTLQTEGAVSCVIIVVDKGNGIVDAFYMYFYSFNQGPSVYGHELGDHLGDWYAHLLVSYSTVLIM